MAVVTTIARPETCTVAKKKPPEAEGQPVAGKSYSFRASRSLAQRIDYVSNGLQVDASNLIRMILAKHLHIYEEQVRELPPQTEGS